MRIYSVRPMPSHVGVQPVERERERERDYGMRKNYSDGPIPPHKGVQPVERERERERGGGGVVALTDTLTFKATAGLHH